MGSNIPSKKKLANNMIKSISILLILLFVNSTNSFDFGKINSFEIDVQSNIYTVTDAELKKFTAEGKLLFTYSNLILGDISNIEVDKTTNIFLYYRDFNNIIFLDNTLSPKYSPIDLSDLGYAEANLACRSYNNSFWIYNPVNQELLRFDQSLQITDRTGNLSNITNVNIVPTQILERNNLLYLRDNEHGIFVFDRYGGYLRNMPFYNLDGFYLEYDKWKMLRNDTSFVFNPISLEVDTIVLPIDNVKQYRVSEGRMMYLLKSGEFGVTKIQEF